MVIFLIIRSIRALLPDGEAKDDALKPKGLEKVNIPPDNINLSCSGIYTH